MSRIRFQGPAGLRLSGFYELNKAAIATCLGRLAGRPMVAGWDVNTEIGVRFWRRQWTRAMRCGDMVRGRMIMDSLQTETSDVYAVETRQEAVVPGRWYTPRGRKTRARLLYLHGGGYAYCGAISHRFAAMLAHRIGAEVFMPHYRLTPEHPHPAQAEDALAAWALVTEDRDPQDIVAIGDSAGGHMALSLLLSLKAREMAQPVLAVGLCPWTDVGDRGASLRTNDATDLVQGWMALEFGRWLDPEGRFGREALSPIFHDFHGLAPIYLQVGGREILRDMIREFAVVQEANGAEVTLDLWPQMPHDFQLFDSSQGDAVAALERIGQAVRWAMGETGRMDPCAMTEVGRGFGE